MSFKIELGSIAQDKITGYVGMVTARTEWLYGCRRYVLQSREMKDGVPVADRGVDEDAIEVVEAAPAHVLHGRGGPGDVPRRQADPRR